jgi:hypothetical protein
MLDFDSNVQDALDRLSPQCGSDPEDIVRQARVRARNLRSARNRRLLVSGVLAVSLLIGGSALAASQFNLLFWTAKDSRAQATFSVDDSQRYTGPAPTVLICGNAGGEQFVCNETPASGEGGRTYSLTGRVDSPGEVNRRSYLDAVAAAQKSGELSADQSAQIHEDLEGVDDELFHALRMLSTVETVSTLVESSGTPDTDLVPPEGVPMWTACRQAAGSSFRCRALSKSSGVAVGTPLYLLQKSEDWVAQPHQAQTPVDVRRLFRALLGRELTPAEVRVLLDIATVGTGGGESSSQGGAERVSP